MDGRALSEPLPRTPSQPFRLPEAAVGMLLMLPAILLLLLLTLYPLLYGIWISFFNKHSFFPQQTFIGLDNYLFLLQRSGILGGGMARHRLCGVDDRAADHIGHGRGAAAQRALSGPQHPARDRDLSLYRADGGRGDHLEMAAQQPVRPDQLPHRGCGPRRPADQLHGQGLDHGVADHRQRVAVLSRSS